MASTSNQRLRRAAEKASKRKHTVAQKRKAELASAAGGPAKEIAEGALAPVFASAASAELFTDGIGWVILARQLPSGTLVSSHFLVDVWCLGIKDSFCGKISQERFSQQYEAYGANRPLTQVPPSVARKLLHEAVEWAGKFGFAPGGTYELAQALYGDTPLADDTFSFGKDGKPFYMSGPNDSPARIRQIMAALDKTGGAGEFDFMVESTALT